MQANCYAAVLKGEISLLEMAEVRVAGSHPEANHTFSVNGHFICEIALSA